MLFCISPSPHGNKFQPELLFLSPKFQSFKSKTPLSLSSFVPSSCFHGSPLSALYTIYLSLRFPLCLSHSVLIFLIFAFISASLPLSHTLLTPAFISFHFHLSFTFSPLQACHSIMLFFFCFLLMESERERGRERKVSYVAPINSVFLITFHSTQSPVAVSTGPVSHLHVLDGVVNS